jgi:hypothetical protein
MNTINAALQFLEHVGGVPNLGEFTHELEEQIGTALKDPAIIADIADPAVSSAIRSRLAGVSSVANQKMVANGWFPLPCQRTEAPPWHTLPGAAIYYLVESAIAVHGLDNEIAGVLQAALLPPVTAALSVPSTQSGSPEINYLDAVSAAIATALTKDLAAQLSLSK